MAKETRKAKTTSRDRTPLDRAAKAGLMAGKLLLEEKRKKKEPLYGLQDATIWIYSTAALKPLEEKLARKITRQPNVTFVTLEIQPSGQVSKRSASMVAKKFTAKR